MKPRKTICAFLSLGLLGLVLDCDQALARSWYDGGSKWGGMVTWKQNCPISDDSAASVYDNGGGNLVVPN